MADIFSSITGASASVAQRYLSAAGGNVEQAVSNYFDNPPPPSNEDEAPPAPAVHREQQPANAAASRLAMPAPGPVAKKPVAPPLVIPQVVAPPLPPVFDIVDKKDGNKQAVLKSSSITATLCDLNVDVTFKASFQNPFDGPIEAVFRYRGDGIVCYGYEVEIGGRRIRSQAQEKSQARDTYDDAISMGGTAFLAEHKDETTFQVSLGAFPPKSECVITFSFLQEASLDEETAETVVDLPMASVVPIEGMSCELNVQGSDVQAIESRSQHPIRTEKTATGMRAILDKTELQREVRLAVRYQDPGLPWPKVETDGNSTAVQIMFVPRVELDDTKGEEVVTEVVILVDRSGSMAGGRLRQTKSSLQILLRSLPQGTLFNIVSFGGTHESLFPSSVELTERTFKQASEAVNAFQANLGGTNILSPLSSILSSLPRAGFPRQVIVMTDGEVDNTDAIIAQVRNATAKTPTRVFSLGIGMDASPALIRGIAKAGHGAGEFVHGEMRIEPVVAHIMQKILRPVIESVSVDWGDLKPAHVTPSAIPTVFSGQKVTSIALLTNNDGQKHDVSLEMKLSGNVTRKYVAQVDLATALPGKTVHRFAASSLVADVVAKRASLSSAEATAFAVRYGIASKLTSLVAVDEDTNATFTNQTMVQVDGNQGVLDAKPAPQAVAGRGGGGGGGGMRRVQVGPGTNNYSPKRDAGKAAPAGFGGGYRAYAAPPPAAPPVGELYQDVNAMAREQGQQQQQQRYRRAASSEDNDEDDEEALDNLDLIKQQDQELGQMEEELEALKSMAAEIGQEVQVQGEMLDRIDEKQLKESNMRLSKKSSASSGAGLFDKIGSFFKREESASGPSDLLGASASAAVASPSPASAPVMLAERPPSPQRKGSASPKKPSPTISPRSSLSSVASSSSLSSSADAKKKSKLRESEPEKEKRQDNRFDSADMHVEIKLDAGARPLDRLLVLQGFGGSWQLTESLATLLGKTLAQLVPPPEVSPEVWATCLALAALEISFASDRAEWELVFKKARKFLSKTPNVDSFLQAAKQVLGK